MTPVDQYDELFGVDPVCVAGWGKFGEIFPVALDFLGDLFASVVGLKSDEYSYHQYMVAAMNAMWMTAIFIMIMNPVMLYRFIGGVLNLRQWLFSTGDRHMSVNNLEDYEVVTDNHVTEIGNTMSQKLEDSAGKLDSIKKPTRSRYGSCQQCNAF